MAATLSEEPRDISILVPDLIWDTRGRLTRWLKKVGDRVEVGDLVAEIETSRAILEVESVDAGILSAIDLEVGAVCVASQPMGRLSTQPPRLWIGPPHQQINRPTSPNPFADYARGQGVHPGSRGVLKPPVIDRRVFVVHGHDEAAKHQVRSFLKCAHFEPVVLHERPNRGRSLLTKFREEADGVGFAVVLMTPDDEGGKSGSKLSPRARQNVIFELGFFIGALGINRVAALVKGSVERPSDFDGVVYIDFDDAGAWRLALGRELEAVGLEINWNDVLRSPSL